MKSCVLPFGGVAVNKVAQKWKRKVSNRAARKNSGIVDSGASKIFFGDGAPVANKNFKAPKVTVGTATGAIRQSAGTADLDLPQLPLGFPTEGHMMPGFPHTLVGLGPLCDAGCEVTFTKDSVVIRDRESKPVLTGWREADGARM